jgi:hypothetical protein
MTTFNLRSYSNGNIVKTLQAENLQKAQNQLEQKGYDCQDDYFLENEKETLKSDNTQAYRSSYTEREDYWKDVLIEIKKWSKV